MDYSYAVTPFLAWFAAGILKFSINSIKAKQLAFGQIGYGGLPSNHSAIVSSMATLVGLKEGFGHPAFGVAITVAFIVMLDANSLRREIGKHAVAINQLVAAESARANLRERMGHTPFEIVSGILVGSIVAATVHQLVHTF
ncbi:MAG: divergent PAP2 family protein [Desulfobulbaceae bacterium]|nr:divergent PAP2 family protein [Desulfobulbaceae bacterium]